MAPHAYGLFLILILAGTAPAQVVETNLFDRLGLEDGEKVRESEFDSWTVSGLGDLLYSTNAHPSKARGCIRFIGSPSNAYRALDALGVGRSNGVLRVEGRFCVNGTNWNDTAGIALRNKGDDHRQSIAITYWGPNRQPAIYFEAYDVQGKHAWNERVATSTGRWDAVRITVDFDRQVAWGEVKLGGAGDWEMIGKERDIGEVLTSVNFINIGGGDPSEAGSYLDGLTIASTAPGPVKGKRPLK
jgi:hypothetical protein